MRLSLAIALLLTSATTLPAQLRVSAGVGYAGPAAISDTDRTHGVSLAVGYERAFVPQLRWSVNATRWQSNRNSSSTNFVTGSLVLYPLLNFGGYVRAGFGYGSAHLVAPTVTYSGGAYNVSGPAFQLGAGYDVNVAPGVSLGAFIDGTNTIGGSGKKYVRGGSGEAALVSFGLSTRVAW